MIARSLSGRRWSWRPAEERHAAAIAQRLDVPEIVGRLMAARGVTPERASAFLNPTLRGLLPDPSSLHGLDAAAERLGRAVQGHEMVGVFGDYDVDGACSAALLAGVLRDLGCEVLTHIPDRLSEGYGPNAPALRGLAERGATLLVCVDCGTAAAGVLAEIGATADILVLDHHPAPNAPPAALATVNPNLPFCGAGLGQLCAAGVAFMAAVGLLRYLRRECFFTRRCEPDLREQLDLVALATVCDVVPLTGPNRALVAQGLKVMARRQRPGLAALLEVAQARDALTAFTCGYLVGPRINAGGRIGEAGLGLRLLLSRDPLEARALAESLDEINRQRRDIEAGILDEASAQAEAQMAAGHAVLFVRHADWHPGIVGIVAGRLKERYHRPACAAGGAGLKDGAALLKGSGRSVAGVDLGATIARACHEGHFLTGGGHAMAAGFSLRPDRAEAAHRFLDEAVGETASEPEPPELLLDAGIAVSAATEELATRIAALAPFGQGNDEPVLMLSRVRVLRADRIGREGTTLRLWIEGEGGGRLKALLFRAQGPLAETLLSRPGPLHMAGHLRAEEWNGVRGVSFFVQDAALA